MRARSPEDIQIAEERRDGVVGDVRVWEGLGLVLGLAVEDGEVAIRAGVDGRAGLAVDVYGGGEGDVAEAVVFVRAGRVAEVARCWGGEDEVRGHGAG